MAVNSLPRGGYALPSEDFVGKALYNSEVRAQPSTIKVFEIEGGELWPDLPWAEYKYFVLYPSDDPYGSYGLAFGYVRNDRGFYAQIGRANSVQVDNDYWLSTGSSTMIVRRPIWFKTAVPSSTGFPALVFQGGPADIPPHGFVFRLTNEEPPTFDESLSTLATVNNPLVVRLTDPSNPLAYASDGVTTGVVAPGAGLVKTSTPRRYGVVDGPAPFAVSSEGNQIVTVAAPDLTFQKATDLTAITNVALQAAAGANIRNYITALTLDNTGTAAARVTILDGTTAIFRATIPAGDSRHFTFPVPLRGSANAVINAALAVAGTVTVSHQGYKGY